MGAGLLLHAMKTCRNNLCIVDDEAVTLVEVVQNIIKMAMIDGTCISIHNKKAGI